MPESPRVASLFGVSNSYSKSVLDRVPYLMWTYDGSGVLDYVNLSWTLYTGKCLRDFSASTTIWSDLLNDSESVPFVDSLNHSMRNGKPFRCETKLRQGLKVGSYRWHEISVEPVFGQSDAVASWVGIAIDIEDRKRAESALNEREQQFQHEVARSTLFQRAVLPPHLPIVPGLEFDAIYEPGLSNEQVGGDWYDAVRLLDGRILLTIGDVSGSGLNAAVVMGVVRQIMRGIAQLHAEPALMLDASDRALRMEYPDHLVTAWVGILDLVGKTLTFASAGHPSPLLLDSNGTVEDLDHLTLPLGLRQGHQGHATTVSISNRSAIWLYTDGLIEATHDIIEGSRLLEETATRLSTEKVAEPAATIRRLIIPNGSPDDVAILVVTIDLDESEKYLTRSQFDSNDPNAASAARQAFRTALPTKYFTDVDVANAEIVFGELCANVVRYAPGLIEIVVDRSGVQTVLHVLDRGVGFRHLSRLPADILAENGRGLFIIAAMTTEFTVSQRIGGGSHARAVLVGRYPISLLIDRSLPAATDQVPEVF